MIMVDQDVDQIRWSKCVAQKDHESTPRTDSVTVTKKDLSSLIH